MRVGRWRRIIPVGLRAGVGLKNSTTPDVVNFFAEMQQDRSVDEGMGGRIRGYKIHKKSGQDRARKGQKYTTQ